MKIAAAFILALLACRLWAIEIAPLYEGIDQPFQNCTANKASLVGMAGVEVRTTTPGLGLALRWEETFGADVFQTGRTVPVTEQFADSKGNTGTFIANVPTDFKTTFSAIQAGPTFSFEAAHLRWSAEELVGIGAGQIYFTGLGSSYSTFGATFKTELGVGQMGAHFSWRAWGGYLAAALPVASMPSADQLQDHLDYSGWASGVQVGLVY